MADRPATVDEYLATLPLVERAGLEAVRQAIKLAAPGAEEYISYGIPTFRFEGKRLLAIGAAAHHCALYPMSASTVEALKDDLTGYSTSKGTIRFKPENPLPAALVHKIVRARIAENRG